MTGLAVRPRLVTTSSPGSPGVTGAPLAGSSTSQTNSHSFKCNAPVASRHSKLIGPTSVRPWWSMTRAPHSRSIRPRVAGMWPPGSPATMTVRTGPSARSTSRLARATSASRSA